MHVGMSTFFQNLAGGYTDQEVYAHEIAMADMAEPLGFDSIWAAEHHFDEYTMCPNVAQFLTYMAGRTNRVGLGSMVMVLPWHDPVRLAEEVLVLDHVSKGRGQRPEWRGLSKHGRAPALLPRAGRDRAKAAPSPSIRDRPYWYGQPYK